MGFRVAVYGEPTGAAAADDDVVVLPRDPRVADYHEILRQLPPMPHRSDVWVWNARDPKRLETYLERATELDVRERLPDAADFDRVVRNRGIAAILVPPGAPDPPLPPGRSWIRVESEAFARPGSDGP
jgi:hypothetical protein